MVDSLSSNASSPLGHHQPLGVQPLGILDLNYFFPAGFPDVEPLADDSIPTPDHPQIHRSSIPEKVPLDKVSSTPDYPDTNVDDSSQSALSGSNATSKYPLIQREVSPGYAEVEDNLPVVKPLSVNRQPATENIPLTSNSTFEGFSIQGRSFSTSPPPPPLSHREPSVEISSQTQTTPEIQTTPGVDQSTPSKHDHLPVVIDFSTPPTPLQATQKYEIPPSSINSIEATPETNFNPKYSTPLPPNPAMGDEFSLAKNTLSTENHNSVIHPGIIDDRNDVDRSDDSKPLPQIDQVFPKTIHRSIETSAQAPLTILDGVLDSLGSKAIAIPKDPLVEANPSLNDSPAILTPEITTDSLISENSPKIEEIEIPSIQRAGVDHSYPLSETTLASTTEALGLERIPISSELGIPSIPRPSEMHSDLASESILTPMTNSSVPEVCSSTGETEQYSIQHSSHNHFDLSPENTPAPATPHPDLGRSPNSEGSENPIVQRSSINHSDLLPETTLTPTIEPPSPANLPSSEEIRSPNVKKFSNLPSDPSSKTTVIPLVEVSIDDLAKSEEGGESNVQRSATSHFSSSSKAASIPIVDVPIADDLLVSEQQGNENVQRSIVEITSTSATGSQTLATLPDSDQSWPQSTQPQSASDDRPNLSLEATSTPITEFSSLDNLSRTEQTPTAIVPRSSNLHSDLPSEDIPVPTTAPQGQGISPNSEGTGNSIVQRSSIDQSHLLSEKISVPTTEPSTSPVGLPSSGEIGNPSSQRLSDINLKLSSETTLAPTTNSPTPDNSPSSEEIGNPTIEGSNYDHFDLSPGTTAAPITEFSASDNSSSLNRIGNSRIQKSSIDSSDLSSGEVSAPITEFSVPDNLSSSEEARNLNVQRLSETLSDPSTEATLAPLVEFSIDGLPESEEIEKPSVQESTNSRFSSSSKAALTSTVDIPIPDNFLASEQQGYGHIQRSGAEAEAESTSTTALQTLETLQSSEQTWNPGAQSASDDRLNLSPETTSTPMTELSILDNLSRSEETPGSIAQRSSDLYSDLSTEDTPAPTTKSPELGNSPNSEESQSSIVQRSRIDDSNLLSENILTPTTEFPTSPTSLPSSKEIGISSSQRLSDANLNLSSETTLTPKIDSSSLEKSPSLGETGNVTIQGSNHDHVDLSSGTTEAPITEFSASDNSSSLDKIENSGIHKSSIDLSALSSGKTSAPITEFSSQDNLSSSRKTRNLNVQRLSETHSNPSTEITLAPLVEFSSDGLTESEKIEKPSVQKSTSSHLNSSSEIALTTTEKVPISDNLSASEQQRYGDIQRSVIDIVPVSATDSQTLETLPEPEQTWNQGTQSTSDDYLNPPPETTSTPMAEVSILDNLPRAEETLRSMVSGLSDLSSNLPSEDTPAPITKSPELDSSSNSNELRNPILQKSNLDHSDLLESPIIQEPSHDYFDLLSETEATLVTDIFDSDNSLGFDNARSSSIQRSSINPPEELSRAALLPITDFSILDNLFSSEGTSSSNVARFSETHPDPSSETGNCPISSVGFVSTPTPIPTPTHDYLKPAVQLPYTTLPPESVQRSSEVDRSPQSDSMASSIEPFSTTEAIPSHNQIWLDQLQLASDSHPNSLTKSISETVESSLTLTSLEGFEEIKPAIIQKTHEDDFSPNLASALIPSSFISEMFVENDISSPKSPWGGQGYESNLVSRSLKEVSELTQRSNEDNSTPLMDSAPSSETALSISSFSPSLDLVQRNESKLFKDIQGSDKEDSTFLFNSIPTAGSVHSEDSLRVGEPYREAVQGTDKHNSLISIDNEADFTTIPSLAEALPEAIQRSDDIKSDFQIASESPPSLESPTSVGDLLQSDTFQLNENLRYKIIQKSNERHPNITESYSSSDPLHLQSSNSFVNSKNVLSSHEQEISHDNFSSPNRSSLDPVESYFDIDSLPEVSEPFFGTIQAYDDTQDSEILQNTPSAEISVNPEVSAINEEALPQATLENQSSQFTSRLIDSVSSAQDIVSPSSSPIYPVQRDVDRSAVNASQTQVYPLNSQQDITESPAQNHYEQLPIVIDFQASPEPLKEKRYPGRILGSEPDRSIQRQPQSESFVFGETTEADHVLSSSIHPQVDQKNDEDNSILVTVESSEVDDHHIHNTVASQSLSPDLLGKSLLQEKSNKAVGYADHISDLDTTKTQSSKEVIPGNHQLPSAQIPSIQSPNSQVPEANAASVQRAEETIFNVPQVSSIDVSSIQVYEPNSCYFGELNRESRVQMQPSEHTANSSPIPETGADQVQRSTVDDGSDLPTEWQSLADLVSFQTSSSPQTSEFPRSFSTASQPSEEETSLMSIPTTPQLISPTSRLESSGNLSIGSLPPVQRKLTVSRTKPVLKSRYQDSIQTQTEEVSSLLAPSGLIQAKEDTPFTTIDVNYGQGTDNRRERVHALEQLAQEIYQRMRQRLVVEKERHGRFHSNRLR